MIDLEILYYFVRLFFQSILFFFLLGGNCAFGLETRDLQVGVASHAFDHLGGFPEQADAAVASGANIIYATGLGGSGYLGLPPAAELAAQIRETEAYNRKARKAGIRGIIGYVCATSIVKLETFDKNWSAELRAQFSTPPAEWLQHDKNGHPLASWYGGDYRPACMNNPDWRRYEKNMVRLQIESGHDGIFFDNPTVHPEGCYCDHCLKKFQAFLEKERRSVTSPLRQFALDHPVDFLLFRSTIASDFMADMRAYARTINPNALITCNNSLNTPDALFSQARTYGYNIYEMSKTEDLVVVEDMASQPRILPGGQTVEYGHSYSMLQAISHHKPLVVCTIADGDYHTAPDLVCLAMAEAAAYDASYLCWPTWPEKERAHMASSIRSEADFLREHVNLLSEGKRRTDVLLFFPFRQWINTATCRAWHLAVELNLANIQYDVVCEDDFIARLKKEKTATLLLESSAVLNGKEKQAVEDFTKRGGKVIFDVKQFQQARSVSIDGNPAVRAVVRDEKHRTIVHLLNLNIQKLTSFTDKITPAENVHLRVEVPFKKPKKVKALSAEGELPLSSLVFDQKTRTVEFTVPKLSIAAIVVIE